MVGWLKLLVGARLARDSFAAVNQTIRIELIAGKHRSHIENVAFANLGFNAPDARTAYGARTDQGCR